MSNLWVNFMQLEKSYLLSQTYFSIMADTCCDVLLNHFYYRHQPIRRTSSESHSFSGEFKVAHYWEQKIRRFSKKWIKLKRAEGSNPILYLSHCEILTVVLDNNMAVVFHIQQDRDNEGVHPRESPPNAYTDCVH